MEHYFLTIKYWESNAFQLIQHDNDNTSLSFTVIPVNICKFCNANLFCTLYTLQGVLVLSKKITLIPSKSSMAWNGEFENFITAAKS